MKTSITFATTTFAMISAATAFAQERIGTTTPAPLKLRAQAQVEVLPIGSGEVTVDEMSAPFNTQTAYAISAAFDVAASRYVTIGVAPRMILHITSSDALDDSSANRELDLRLRLLGHVPLMPRLEAYAYFAPGYTVMMPSDDGARAKGVSVGGAVGATYDVSPMMFVNGEVGYQHAGATIHAVVDNQRFPVGVDLSYLHFGVGAGSRF